MADLTRFITYYIVLSDPALVAQYQAQFPFGYQYAPWNPLDSSTGQPGGAAVAFSAPWTGSTPGAAAPYTYSPDAGNYPTNVATFTRKSGGFWGMGGTTTRYYWVGQFKFDEPVFPTVGGVPPPVPANMPTRRFIEGFECGTAGPLAGVPGVSGLNYSRDAARHVGGRGLAVRGSTNSVSAGIAQDKYGAPLKYYTWERFYVRLRATDPSQTVIFWQTRGDVVPLAGAALGVAADGRLALFMSDGTGNQTFVATSVRQLTVWNGSSTDDGWHKIDVLLRYNPSPVGGSGRFALYIDGEADLEVNGLVTGIGLSNQHHKSSNWGNPSLAANVMELDIDDWMACDMPGDGTDGPGLKLTGADWLSGTKITLARPKQFGISHDAVGWTGDLRITMQNPLTTTLNSTQLNSSASGAIAEVDLDVDQTLAQDDGGTRVGSFAICAILASNLGSGELGYLLNGAGPVMTALTQQAANTVHSVFKSRADNSANTFPTTTTLSVRHTKAANVNPATLVMMMAQVELSGAWQKCDYRSSENGGFGTPTFPRWVGQHNAPFPRAMFSKGTAAPPPDSPVIVTTGTYVGNGTGQDITFRTPPHFLWIRPLSGDSGGFKWWSTLEASHRNIEQSATPFIANVDLDTTFVPGLGDDVQQQRYRARIAGNSTQINAVGVTYQYVAFSDPGARYALAGEFTHRNTLATFTNVLVNPTFTPEFLLLWAEDNSTTTTGSLYAKGIGGVADSLYCFDLATAVLTALELGAGYIRSKANLHTKAGGNAFPFLAFRRHDGNNDPGEPGVMALLTWTGDGTASRTLSIAPMSGKRPIFALVVPSDAGGGYFRDPSHTGVNSSKAGGTNATTGITGGGIDSLSVGAALNVNGTVYNAIVFLGDATAGNGGFGVNGEYIPVEAAPPADGPWPQPTLADLTPPPPPVTPLVGEPDLEDSAALTDAATEIGGLVGGQHCEYYTRHVVNLALSRIGISKSLTNLATDNSQEAIIARRHVLEDVNATLRDFDWPFATRYANLVLVGGTTDTPVNGDWQYSYRAPNSMIKARRLVNQNGAGRAFDPNPPKFRIGGDDSGPLVYTNEVATSDLPLVLEYTVRNICPAFYGDALFRDALAWRFAASAAPALAKDKDKQQFCLQMYRLALGRAEVPAAQEQQQAPGGDADWIQARDGCGAVIDPWRRV